MLQFLLYKRGNLKKKIQLFNKIGSEFIVGLSSIEQNYIVESAIGSQFEKFLILKFLYVKTKPNAGRGFLGLFTYYLHWFESKIEIINQYQISNAIE